MELNTPGDWWTLVSSDWDNLLDLCQRFGPTQDQIRHQSLIPMEDLVKGRVEWWQYLTGLKKEKRQDELHNVFEKVWGSTPDVPGLGDIPGWWNLCDLCSEFWVFNGNEPEDLQPTPPHVDLT